MPASRPRPRGILMIGTAAVLLLVLALVPQLTSGRLFPAWQLRIEPPDGFRDGAQSVEVLDTPAGRLAIYREGGSLTVLDAETGTRRFSAEARGALVSARFSPDRAVAWVSDWQTGRRSATRTTAFSTVDGRELWAADGEPHAARDGVVLLADGHDGRTDLVGLDEETGDTRWRHDGVGHQRGFNDPPQRWAVFDDDHFEHARVLGRGWNEIDGGRSQLLDVRDGRRVADLPADTETQQWRVYCDGDRFVAIAGYGDRFEPRESSEWMAWTLDGVPLAGGEVPGAVIDFSLSGDRVIAWTGDDFLVGGTGGWVRFPTRGTAVGWSQFSTDALITLDGEQIVARDLADGSTRWTYRGTPQDRRVGLRISVGTERRTRCRPGRAAHCSSSVPRGQRGPGPTSGRPADAMQWRRSG